MKIEIPKLEKITVDIKIIIRYNSKHKNVKISFHKEESYMKRHNDALVVEHPVFGKIRIEEKFKRVLELKPFRELAYKSQLGTKIFSNVLLNTRHTRLMHSIGVMYLTSYLLNICEDKFSKYFPITLEDKETLKLAALGHDLGHIAFSHSLEDKNMKTHEQRTIEYFEEYSDEINEIFGYDIVSKVIQIYRDNIDFENQEVLIDSGDLNMLFIFKSLLIGAIDCDRMEYITTDRFNIYGERVNYQDILKYITIVLLNGSPTVGFEKAAVPMIEDMLFTRFNQYLEIYYDDESTLTEILLKKYKELEGWEEAETVSKAEYEILAELKAILSDYEEQGTIRYRIAQTILEGNRENILLKRFESDKEFENFLQKLERITKRKDIINTSKKKVAIYDPQKSKVWIKDNNGIVKDLMEVSHKIQDISISCNYIMVDLDPVYNVDSTEMKNIRKLFSDNPVEIEKKFISKEDLCKREWYEKVESALKSIPDIQIKDFREWEKVVNDDLYFEGPNYLPPDVAMRCRTTENGKSYYIKTPADDGTSITKRYEDEIYCQNDDEFFEVVKKRLESDGYYVKGMEITEGVKIRTERFKTLVEVHDSIIEIACDFSVYTYGNKRANGMMLECERKEGDEIALWYLAKHLVKEGFIETNKSKRARAKEELGIE